MSDAQTDNPTEWIYSTSDKNMKSDWVNCPICGCPDMRQTEDMEGNKLINCTNHACKSNGGTYQKPHLIKCKNKR